MPLSAASDLGLHCLLMSFFMPSEFFYLQSLDQSISNIIIYKECLVSFYCEHVLSKFLYFMQTV